MFLYGKMFLLEHRPVRGKERRDIQDSQAIDLA